MSFLRAIPRAEPIVDIMGGTNSETEFQCKKCGYFDKGLFCSNCGQAHYKSRLSLAFLLDKIITEVINVRKYIPTFNALWQRPIEFISEYIHGDRDKYYTPFKYLFINMGISFFLSHYNYTSLDTDIYLDESERLLDQIINEYGKLYFLLIIPIFTACTKLLNRAMSFNVAEIVTAITFLLAQMMCLVIALHLITLGFHAFYPIQKIIIFIAQLTIIFLLNYKLLKNDLFASTWKSLITILAIYFGMKYAILLTHEVILINQST